MPAFICNTCGTQYEPSDKPPAACPICDDERQYVTPAGQSWTTLPALQGRCSNGWRELEPNLIALVTFPAFGIGQRAQLLRTPHGNILWDCISLIDRATVDLDQGHGRHQGHRDLAPALLLLHGRVEPGVRRHPGPPARRRPQVDHAQRSGDHALAGRDQGAAAGRHADLRRRPLSGRHGAALGRGRRRQGRASVRRHRAGGAGQQVGELHVEFPELHPAVGTARRGRGRSRSSRSSSIASTALSTTAPSGRMARQWSSARPSATSRSSAATAATSCSTDLAAAPATMRACGRALGTAIAK